MQLDPNDPLLKLSTAIPWHHSEEAFSIHYQKTVGAPSKPILLMVGLLLLKQLEDLSDEEDCYAVEAQPLLPGFLWHERISEAQPPNSFMDKIWDRK